MPETGTISKSPSPPTGLVLLPGMDGSGRLFYPLLARLPDWVTPSVIPYPTRSPQDYAALAHYVRARLPKDGPYVLLGESFGGALALHLTARRPPGLRGVILASSFIRPPHAMPAPWLDWVAQPWMYHLLCSRWALRLFLLGAGAEPQLVDTLLQAVKSCPPKILLARLHAIASVDAVDALKQCPLPVLAITGTHDRLVSRTAYELMRRVRPDIYHLSLDAPHAALQRAAGPAAAGIVSFIESLVVQVRYQCR